jgi:hypothetical protein
MTNATSHWKNETIQLEYRRRPGSDKTGIFFPFIIQKTLERNQGAMTSESTNHQHLSDFGGPVQIEAFGIHGALGRPAGKIKRRLESPLGESSFWHHEHTTAGTHIALVADFSTDESHEVLLRYQGTEAFRIWIDGNLVAWGPHRFAIAMPELASTSGRISGGNHRIAIHAVHVGLTNRIASDVPPFMSVQLSIAGTEKSLPLEWRSRVLDEFLHTGLRVSPLQGWFEWLDRPLDRSWIEPNTATNHWAKCSPVDQLSDIMGLPTVSDLKPPKELPALEPLLVDSGVFRDTYPAYRWDDPAIQFLLADRQPRLDDDPDGTYWVYDLGRIRIGAMELDIRCSRNVEVTIAYGERRGPDGNVSPSVALSAGRTMFLQHFTVNAEHSVIAPIQPLGARWIEVRLQGDMEARIGRAIYRERDYLGETPTSIRLGNQRLEEIWSVGLETLRASAEDALVDSVRERGEWVGDVAIAGMELSAIGWARVDHAKRALLHSAATAREDGLVSGCGPGELLYLGTYAMHWMSAVVRCAELEGSTSLLAELQESGAANIGAIIELIEDDGSDRLPWPFIDWGYLRVEGEPDIAALCHAVRACRAWRKWLERLGAEPGDLERRVTIKENAILRVLGTFAAQPENLGYHALVLLAELGKIPPDIAGPLVLSHMKSSFPFAPDAKRLRDCTSVEPDAVTPYFSNYSINVIVESLGIDTALELWEEGWGWMLDRGATTWWEVFDDRWSQCHYWSGSPTWQISKFILGLWIEWQGNGPIYRLAVRPGSLPEASGIIGGVGGEFLDVDWTRTSPIHIRYRLSIKSPARLASPGRQSLVLEPGQHEFTLIADGEVFVLDGN